MIIEYYSGKIEAKLDKSSKVLADGVELAMDEGDTVAIVGESGSGKTIIANSIMKLLPSNVTSFGSRLVFCGEDLTYKKNIRNLLGELIVYIPQNGHEALNPSRTIKKQIFDGLLKLRVPRNDLVHIATEKLSQVGFENPADILNKYPFELSGGMAQRVVVAIASCSNAKLIIADEPTNGMESESKFAFSELMNSLFPSACKLVITHDISVARTCEKTIVLCKGKVMECGRTDEVLKHPRSPYTIALINSLVENEMCVTPRLRSGEGKCPFYARCPLATDACLDDIPERNEDGVIYACTI